MKKLFSVNRNEHKTIGSWLISIQCMGNIRNERKMVINFPDVIFMNWLTKRVKKAYVEVNRF